MYLLSEVDNKILSAVQDLFLQTDGPQPTVETLRGYVEQVCTIFPQTPENPINKEAVIHELIRRHAIWTGEARILYSPEGHQDWLNSDRKDGWVYWPRYKKYIEDKIGLSVADDIDRVTDNILGLIEDPQRKSPWDRRGLVVGHVQSGKTSNYTGLICKAADAGYRIIIVLAGLTNSLRTQTQIRLEEGFLGYITGPVGMTEFTPIGVGLINNDPTIRPNHVTNRLEKGDFSLAVAKNLGITPENRPWLFVVKKNKAILNRIYKWLENYVTNYTDQDGIKHIRNLPLLLIDDESDNASVDTSKDVINPDGTPDRSHDPKAINKGIRKILNIFEQSAYVGYTATPFANIFIHTRGYTEKDRTGKDLFPESFIINLSASSDYFGPVKMFGTQSDEGQQNILSPYLTKSIRDVPPEGGWMPLKHKSSHYPATDRDSHLPKSLEDAILSFFLVCAARRLRGQKTQHSSMLVHVSRYVAVQGIVYEQIGKYIRYCRRRIVRAQDDFELKQRLKETWENDFEPNSLEVLKITEERNLEIPSWLNILKELPYVLEDLQVMVLNGHSKDVLAYEDHKNTGLKVIAIGGDKLSRGLTLEGLSISYFLRSSNMYDTLMQMGRWFGYRRGYLDLCRLYTTDDLIMWFEQITDATEKLRNEFDIMEQQNLTPKDYGLRVQHYPDLQVTSREKSRSSEEWNLTFEGSRVQTVVFHNELEPLKHNYETVIKLLNNLGAAFERNPRIELDNTRSLQWTGVLWRDVSSNRITEFLYDFHTHKAATKINSGALIEYVQRMNEAGYLSKWSVSLLGADSARTGGTEIYDGFPMGIKIPSIYRSKANKDQDDRYSIKVLTSNRDEVIDFNPQFLNEALEQSARILQEKGDILGDMGTQIVKEAARTVRATNPGTSVDRGLLNIYVVDSKALELSEKIPIIGFSIIFPNTRSGQTVRYKVDQVFSELWDYNMEEDYEDD